MKSHLLPDSASMLIAGGFYSSDHVKSWKSPMCKSNTKATASFGRESAVFKAHLI